MSPKIAIIYYSSGGNVSALARAIEQGAVEAGAEVRLRRVAELTPGGPVAEDEQGAPTAGVPEAELADLEWADGLVFGTPTRYGNVCAELKQFLDSTADLWFRGRLADKAVSGFVSSHETHGGQESTLLSMYQVFMHWGAVIVPPGYTDDSIFASGGNPYGVGSVQSPSDEDLASARFLGGRLAEKARLLSASYAG